MILAALLLAAAHPASLAGTYEIHQMEMAGGLELTRDGRFRYAFDNGAASEIAEGHWTSDGKTVRLTSNRMPKLTALVTLDGVARPVAIYAEENGRVMIPEGRRATAVRVKMPLYEGADRPVPLSADRGHRLLFRLDTNDVGQAPFRGEALVIQAQSAGAPLRHGNLLQAREAITPDGAGGLRVRLGEACGR